MTVIIIHNNNTHGNNMHGACWSSNKIMRLIGNHE